MEKIFNIRVKPAIELPHKFSKRGVTYVFAPEASPAVEEDLGKALVTTYPEIYEVVTGKTDKSLYTFKDETKNKSIADLVAMLNDENKAKVYSGLAQLIKEQNAELLNSEDSESGLGDLSKSELLKLVGEKYPTSDKLSSVLEALDIHVPEAVEKEEERQKFLLGAVARLRNAEIVKLLK